MQNKCFSPSSRNIKQQNIKIHQFVKRKKYFESFCHENKPIHYFEEFFWRNE